MIFSKLSLARRPLPNLPDVGGDDVELSAEARAPEEDGGGDETDGEGEAERVFGNEIVGGLSIGVISCGSGVVESGMGDKLRALPKYGRPSEGTLEVELMVEILPVPDSW